MQLIHRLSPCFWLLQGWQWAFGRCIKIHSKKFEMDIETMRLIAMSVFVRWDYFFSCTYDCNEQEALTPFLP